MSPSAKAPAATLLIGSLALIVAATTMPWSHYYVGHAHWAGVEWIPFSRRVRPEDFVLNVLLFVPFGYAAVRTFTQDTAPPPRRIVAAVVVAGCLVSVAVEYFQVYCHGRIPTSVDVISNTTGAWLGAWLSARPDRGPYAL